MNDGQFSSMTEQNPKRKKRSGVGLVLAIALLYFLWLIFYGYTVEILNWDEMWALFTFERWVNAGVYLYLFLILVEILLLTTAPREKETKTNDRKNDTAAEREVILPTDYERVDVLRYTADDYGDSDSKRMAAVKKSTLIERALAVHNYPENVSGGAYGVNYVQLGTSNVLRISSFLARPCALCEQRDSCFERYRDKISVRDFDDNLDCVEGLETQAAQNSWQNSEWENT